MAPKKTPVAKAGKKVKAPVRPMREDELMELQELHRAASVQRFIGGQVKGNTALVPNGQLYAEQCEAVARLLENAKNQWVARKLVELGYAPNELVQIDMVTGVITRSTKEKPGPAAAVVK